MVNDKRILLVSIIIGFIVGLVTYTVLIVPGGDILYYIAVAFIVGLEGFITTFILLALSDQISLRETSSRRSRHNSGEEGNINEIVRRFIDEQNRRMSDDSAHHSTMVIHNSNDLHHMDFNDPSFHDSHF